MAQVAKHLNSHGEHGHIDISRSGQAGIGRRRALQGIAVLTCPGRNASGGQDTHGDRDGERSELVAKSRLRQLHPVRIG
jgi:hypothetical protein